MNQPKLQQLHALLLMGDEHAYAKRGDLRDLVACFLDEEKTDWDAYEHQFRLHAKEYFESTKAKAADVNASPPGAPTGVDAAVARLRDTVWHPDSDFPIDDVTLVLSELARLRAEAKPEPAGREVWVIAGNKDRLYVFDDREIAESCVEERLGEKLYRAALEEVKP